MLKRLFVIGAAAASAAAAYGFVQARTAFRSWGIDPAEGARELPGDELVAEAEAIDTRGIDIDAPPAGVWPWLVQMGYGRAGWYSYDELDMDRPSADRIVPELQHIEVGEVLPSHPGGGFEVRIIEPEAALVLYADRALVNAQAEAATEGLDAASANVRAAGAYLDASMPGEFQASWAFVLEPRPEGRTRLIERFRGHMAPPEGRPAPPAIAAKALLFGIFVMVRRQMLGIRDRAEGRPISHAPWREVSLRARERAMEAAATARAQAQARAQASATPAAPAAPTGVEAVAAPA
jgi:hypothetical protein